MSSSPSGDPSVADTSLWDELQEAWDSHVRLSFTDEPPDEPALDRLRLQGERAARVVLGMPFLPVALLRIRNSLVRRGVPLLPYACELLANVGWRVAIGRYVQVGPGLILPHGHVVVDGEVRIGRDVVINPWSTIGLSGARRLGFDMRGPTIGDRVMVGTGAKLLGPITIGDDVRIGANAVVIDDVPTGATVVGAPARVIESKPPAWMTAPR